MYKIIWDSETGGVRMLSHFTVDTLTVSPRPVFYEELDMLRLDKLGWQYPKCQEPLLWASNISTEEHLFLKLKVQISMMIQP